MQVLGVWQVLHARLEASDKARCAVHPEGAPRGCRGAQRVPDAPGVPTQGGAARAPLPRLRPIEQGGGLGERQTFRAAAYISIGQQAYLATPCRTNEEVGGRVFIASEFRVLARRDGRVVGEER